MPLACTNRSAGSSGRAAGLATDAAGEAGSGVELEHAAANSAFLSEQNILSLARFAVPYVVIASGLCLLLICGELDLSVGQSFAFAPIVMYLAYDKLFLVLPLAVLVDRKSVV